MDACCYGSMLMSSLATSRVRSFVRSLRREGEKVRKYTSVSRSANSFDRCNRKRIPFLELAIVSIERRYDERPARKEKSAGLDSLWREGELSLFLSLARSRTGLVSLHDQFDSRDGRWRRRTHTSQKTRASNGKFNKKETEARIQSRLSSVNSIPWGRVVTSVGRAYLVLSRTMSIVLCSMRISTALNFCSISACTFRMSLFRYGRSEWVGG